MKRYVKKPVVIEAVKLERTHQSVNECMRFMNELKSDASSMEMDKFYEWSEAVIAVGKGLFINTLEGTMLCSWGDYIIKGVKGEFYPCKSDIFRETYESYEKHCGDCGSFVDEMSICITCGSDVVADD